MKEITVRTLTGFQKAITELKGDFIYRGQMDADWEVESGAYSRLEGNHDTDIIKYTNNIIDKAKTYTQDIKDGQHDMDLLAELQHYGCATPLIDFSYNALIALWFAIENTEKNGKVFCLNMADNDKLLEVSSSDTKELLTAILTLSFREAETLSFRETGKVYTLGKWQPSLNNNRIMKQDSVFIFNTEGRIEEEEFATIITITKGFKQKIQTELKQLTNLADTNIYPDFYGFASNNARNKKYREPTSAELNTKAHKYYRQGNYQKAIHYLELALASDLKTYGKQHPEVATCRNNLGLVWKVLGEYEKAIDYYELALASNLKTYGEQHSSVATCRNNLGDAWQALGKDEKAIDYFELALTSDLKTYGAQHPEVARDRNNLGLAWRVLGEYEKAIDYFELALASGLKTYGEQHPKVATRHNNLGSAWHSLGEYKKAIDCYKEALTILHKVFGDEHPNIKTTQENLEIAIENLKKK